MKLGLLVFSMMGSVLLTAEAQTGSQSSFFDQLRDDAIILSDIGLIKGKEKVEAFLKESVGSQDGLYAYEKDFGIEVRAHLTYEIGTLTSDSKTLDVMLIRSTNEAVKQGIELLVMYEKLETSSRLSDLDQPRNEWMELCNAHKVDQLVNQLYASEAYYYNRGRLLQGTKAITEEYGYMKNPSYSLKLTPKHINFVSPDTAYEIGQCSGSYPNPYMLLWGKNDDDKWVILMDSND